MGGIEIGALMVALGTIVTFYVKLRNIEKSIESMVDTKIKARVEIEEDLNTKDDLLTEEKFKNLWQKVNSLETQIQGNPKYRVEGLIVTIEKIKMILKSMGKGLDDD